MEGNFPVRLHYMLTELEKDGDDDIISWQPHGRCFNVHKRNKFVANLLPLWFSQSKFTSFQRQLNLYGFRRISSGIDKNCYYHVIFLRGYPELSKNITRVKGKGQGISKSDLVDSDPDFYEMPFLPTSSKETNKSGKVHVQHEDQKPAFSSRHDKAGSQEQGSHPQEPSSPPPVFFDGHPRQQQTISSTMQENPVSGPVLEYQDSSTVFAINRERIQDHLLWVSGRESQYQYPSTHEIFLSNAFSRNTLNPIIPSISSSTRNTCFGNHMDPCLLHHQNQLQMNPTRLFSLSNSGIPGNREYVSIQNGHSTLPYLPSSAL